jgi:SAM-dependent methyltransferase
MREFYEAFWAAAPRNPTPYEFALRKEILLDEVKPGERVLDLGCGAGAFLALLENAVGVEIAEEAAQRARANVPGADVRLLDDGAIPLEHGSVDLVWCSEVLEHIPDVGATLNEVRRVLKPGGRLLLTVPFHNRALAAAIALTRFESHFDPLGQHVRFFTRRSLMAALLAAGFNMITTQRRRRMLVALAIR